MGAELEEAASIPPVGGPGQIVAETIVFDEKKVEISWRVFDVLGQIVPLQEELGEK